jgi:hypothetical protein
MRTKLFAWFVIAIVGWSLCPFAARAADAGAVARFSFATDQATVEASSTIVVRVMVDAHQPLNAYAGTIRYDPDLISVERIDDHGSIVDIWPDRPTVTGEGSIRFAGASLTALTTEGELFRIVFRARAVGAASLRITEAEAYLANGKGTRVQPELDPLEIAIAVSGTVPGSSVGASGSATGTSAGTEDVAPPVITEATLETDPIQPDQKLFTYVVRDEESGIESIEYRYRKLISWSPWLMAPQPAPIPGTAWQAELRVTDHAGNEAMVVKFDYPVLAKKALIAVAACVGLGIVVFFVW